MRVTVPVDVPDRMGTLSAGVEVDDADAAGRAVIVRLTLLPRRLARLLPARERAPPPPGVEAPEREMRDKVPDLVRWWWRLVDASSKGVSGTRLVELSRLESQLWPFSSRVEEARAIPARSIHSASDLDFGVLSGKGRRPCKCEIPDCFLCVFGM